MADSEKAQYWWPGPRTPVPQHLVLVRYRGNDEIPQRLLAVWCGRHGWEVDDVSDRSRWSTEELLLMGIRGVPADEPEADATGRYYRWPAADAPGPYELAHNRRDQDRTWYWTGAVWHAVDNVQETCTTRELVRIGYYGVECDPPRAAV